jgi:hypothetical protein
MVLRETLISWTWFAEKRLLCILAERSAEQQQYLLKSKVSLEYVCAPLNIDLDEKLFLFDFSLGPIVIGL